MHQTNHHWVISEFRDYVESSVMGSSHMGLNSGGTQELGERCSIGLPL